MSDATAGTTDDVLLEADGVNVRFGGLLALSEVCLHTRQGRITGLVGPNGAGKTTLFGVLTGYVRPLGGRVLFRGQEITRKAPQERARLGISRTFQHPQLFASLSVAEHLSLGYRMGNSPGRILRDLAGINGWRRPKRAEREAVDTLIEVLGLQAVAHRGCASLPTGIARLVEVGRALAAEPTMLLLDEPAAGLDERESDELFRALQLASADKGVSLLVVEHDLDFVMGLCEFVYVLDAGALIASGTPGEVQSNPAVQEAYLGAEHVSGGTR